MGDDGKEGGQIKSVVCVLVLVFGPAFPPTTREDGGFYLLKGKPQSLEFGASA